MLLSITFVHGKNVLEYRLTNLKQEDGRVGAYMRARQPKSKQNKPISELQRIQTAFKKIPRVKNCNMPHDIHVRSIALE